MNPSENVNVKVESGKYTVLHAGKALNDFLNRVTITETRIGEFSSSKPFDRTGASKNYDLICSGHMVSTHEEVSWIYTGIDTPLDANPKFKRAFDTCFTLTENWFHETVFHFRLPKLRNVRAGLVPYFFACS